MNDHNYLTSPGLMFTGHVYDLIYYLVKYRFISFNIIALVPKPNKPGNNMFGPFKIASVEYLILN